MTEEEDDEALFEEEEAIFLLLLDCLLLLDPIASLQDDNEESSSFEEVPLSPPQATRAMVRKIASRDCIAGLAMTLFKPTITLFIPNFLILYSFFSSMRNFHTLQTSSIYPINIRNYY